MVAELKAMERKETGTRNNITLRSEGQLPAVIYSAGKPGTLIAVEERLFKRLLIAGERVVSLTVGARTAQALIKEVQYDALGEQILHVDFNELKEGQKVRVKVPLAFRGIPAGASEGGVANYILHEVEINCLPTAIPDKITVDLEGLKMGAAIHVSEIKFPEGVSFAARGNDVVVLCEEPRVEEVAAVPAAGSATEPEVLTAKKDDAADAAGAGAAGDKKPAGGDKKPAGGDKKK